MALPPLRILAALLTLLVGLGLSGCGKKTSDPAAKEGATAGLTSVRFLTDWYPQGEHGGIYQAFAKGFYRDAGLEVEILPGGPGPTVPQKMIGGAADLAIGRSDDLIMNIEQGLPFVIVGALMQHDPQAILLHEESSVRSFADLNGRTVMAIPGAAWADYLKRQYKIDFKLTPLNHGIAQFMADKDFIQQRSK